MEYSELRATSRKRAREEESHSSPKRSRVTQWLVDTTIPTFYSHRCTQSAPDQFTERANLKLCHPQGRTLDDLKPALDDMESATTEESELAASYDNKSYKSTAGNLLTLAKYGIHNDPSGRTIPASLKAFLKDKILGNTGARLVNKLEFEIIMNMYDILTQANETLVSQLLGTRMFPVLLKGLAIDGETIWDTTALPQLAGLPCPLVAPKPNFYVGYCKSAAIKLFDVLQVDLMNHPVSRHYASPPKEHYFPFLVMEVRSEPAGGSLTKADYQAATGGAACVKGLRWFFDTAKKPRELENVEKTIAFSISMNHRLINLNVHWYEAADSQVVMSLVRAFLITQIKDVRQFAATLSNIYKWAMGERKDSIHSMLRSMCESPPDWMRTAASVKSQSVSGVEDSTELMSPPKSEPAIWPA